MFTFTIICLVVEFNNGNFNLDNYNRIKGYENKNKSNYMNNYGTENAYFSATTETGRKGDHFAKPSYYQNETLDIKFNNFSFNTKLRYKRDVSKIKINYEIM